MTDNTQGRGHIKNSALKTGDTVAPGQMIGSIGSIGSMDDRGDYGGQVSPYRHIHVSKSSIIAPALRSLLLGTILTASVATAGFAQALPGKKAKTEKTIDAPKAAEKKLSNKQKKKLIAHNLDSLTKNDTTYLNRAKRESHKFAVQQVAPDTSMVIDLPFAPLQGATWDQIRLGSIYGKRPPPRTKNGGTGSEEHRGLDISSRIRTASGHGAAGDKVVASRDGEVVRIGYSSNGEGGSIDIKHKDPVTGGEYITSYLHVKPRGHELKREYNAKKKKSELVTVPTAFGAIKVGDKVDGNDLIAELGEAGVGKYGGGQNTNPHLHFTITTQRDKNDKIPLWYVINKGKKVDIRNDVDAVTAVFLNKGKAFMFKGETARRPDIHPALLHAFVSAPTKEEAEKILKQIKDDIRKRIDPLPASRMISAIESDRKSFVKKYDKLQQERFNETMLSLPEFPEEKPEEENDFELSDYLAEMWTAMDATRMVAGADLSDEMMAALFDEDSAETEYPDSVVTAEEKEQMVAVGGEPVSGDGNLPVPQKEQPIIHHDPSSSRSEDDDHASPEPKSDGPTGNPGLNWDDFVEDDALARIREASQMSIAEMALQAQQSQDNEVADNMKTANSAPLFRMQSFRDVADTVRNNFQKAIDTVKNIKVQSMTFSGKRGSVVPVVGDGLVTRIKKTLFKGGSMTVTSRDAAGNVTKTDYEHLKIRRDLEVGDMMIAGDVAGFTKGRHPAEIYEEAPVVRLVPPQEEVAPADTATAETVEDKILSDIASLGDMPKETLEITEVKEIVSDTASAIIDVPQIVSDTVELVIAEEVDTAIVAKVAPTVIEAAVPEVVQDTTAVAELVSEAQVEEISEAQKDAELLARIVAQAEKEAAEDKALMDKIVAAEEKELAEKFKADSAAAVTAAATKVEQKSEQEVAVKPAEDDNNLLTGGLVVGAAALLLIAAANKRSREKIKALGLAAVLSASVAGDVPAKAEVQTENVAPSKAEKKERVAHSVFKQNASHMTERQKKKIAGTTVKIMGHDVELDDKMIGVFESVYGSTAARNINAAKKKDANGVEKGFGEQSFIGKVLHRDFGVNKAEMTQPVTETGFIIVPQEDKPLDELQLERIRKASEIPMAQWALEAQIAKKQKMQPSFA
jgi:murein DD-endopeptidase MepM/ murein hydrolase activator NlpD